jgi:hypothetical protein
MTFAAHLSFLEVPRFAARLARREPRPPGRIGPRRVLERSVKTQIRGVLSRGATRSSMFFRACSRSRVTKLVNFGTWNRVSGRVPKLQNWRGTRREDRAISDQRSAVSHQQTDKVPSLSPDSRILHPPRRISLLAPMPRKRYPPAGPAGRRANPRRPRPDLTKSRKSAGKTFVAPIAGPIIMEATCSG